MQQYVGGYVVRVLRQHKNCSSIRHIIEGMIDACKRASTRMDKSKVVLCIFQMKHFVYSYQLS